MRHKFFYMKTTIFRLKHKLLFCASLFCYLSFSQDLERQMTLVRPFEPSVSDAQKITRLPNLQDTFSIRPTFIYSIASHRIDTRFDITPVPPVRVQPLTQTKLYHGYMKLGFGTLPNISADVAINTLRNREYAAGALFGFNHADGEVKLDNDEKVIGKYSDISGKLFGKRFFRNNSILFGELGASGQTAYNYGYDTNAVDVNGNPPNLVDDSDLRKSYFFADANIGIRSSHFRADRLNYNVQLDYKFARNKLNENVLNNLASETKDISERIYSENAFTFSAQLDNNMFGGNLKLDQFQRSIDFDSLRNNFALDLNPWFMLDNDSVQLKVGMRVAVYKEGDKDTQYAIFPSIEFQFTLLKDIFIPFLGIDGYMQPNSYRSIVNENPFITPGLAVPMSKTKLQIYAGLKGTITSKLGYYLRLDFINTDKEHFFVNDAEFSLHQNHFTVVTDDMNTFRFKGELYFNPVESIEFGLKANYFKYQLKRELHAWHKPDLTLDFLAKYNLNNKIIANLDVMHIGKRYARVRDFSVTDGIAYNPEQLKSVLSFNVGAEYRYTKTFSLFLKLNNIGSKYDRWNFYPTRRFSAMAGFTYSL